MNRLMMSCAAAGLLRALSGRACVKRDRFLLTEYRSVDWQSLTFIGERHQFRFRLAGPDSDRAFECLTCGLEDAEFTIPRQIVASVSLNGSPEFGPDGSISFGIEALTIEE
jgi:hypothetical protein